MPRSEQARLAVRLRAKADGYPQSKAAALMYSAAYELEQAEARVRGLQEQIEAKDAQLHFLRREIDGMEAEVAALVSANKETAE